MIPKLSWPETLNSVRTWAILAVALLAVFNGYSLLQSPYLHAPPLPGGDGPDYEALAYSLSIRSEFGFSWNDAQWQTPYRSFDALNGSNQSDYSQLERKAWTGPTASRPPALPFLISLIYQILPRGPIAFSCVRLLSLSALTLAGVLSVSLAGRVLSCLTKSIPNSLPVHRNLIPIACSTALALAVMDRTIKVYLQDFLTEPWAVLGVTSLIWCFVLWIESPKSLLWIILSGVIFALLILFRSLFIFWLPPIFVGVSLVSWMMQDKSTRWWVAPVGFILAICLCAGPWWIRNCELTGRWMPMGTQGPASLRGGYCDQALADWGNWQADAEIAMQSELDRKFPSHAWTAIERELALADLASQETWDWIESHLSDLPKLGFMRIVSHWGPIRVDHILWKFSAILGLLFVFRIQRLFGIILASIFVADFLTTILLYETGGRFLIPLHGCLYALAGVGVACCLASVPGNPVHPVHGNGKVACEQSRSSKSV